MGLRSKKTWFCRDIRSSTGEALMESLLEMFVHVDIFGQTGGILVQQCLILYMRSIKATPAAVYSSS
jgi:hypothetical protein